MLGRQSIGQIRYGQIVFRSGHDFSTHQSAAKFGSQQAALARKFIAFLRSDAVQKDIPTSMWMYPVQPGIALDPVFQHAEKPAAHTTPNQQQIAANSAGWVGEWTRIVLKSGQ